MVLCAAMTMHGGLIFLFFAFSGERNVMFFDT
jgi:hypothetical protein